MTDHGVTESVVDDEPCWEPVEPVFVVDVPPVWLLSAAEVVDAVEVGFVLVDVV